MGQINCYIPIKLCITGRLSDTQLEQLGETLTRTLRERIAFAERAILTASGDSSQWSDRISREVVDGSRLSQSEQTYRIPFYNGGGTEQPVSLEAWTTTSETRQVQQLTYFSDLQQVFDAIKQFYPNPRPRGNTFFGVYGYWEEDAKPYLFYVSELTLRGTARERFQLSFIQLSWGRLENGEFIPGDEPIPVEIGARYRLEALPKPKVHRRVTYEVILQAESDDSTRPIFMPASLLRGRAIQFGVSGGTVEQIILTETLSQWLLWWYEKFHVPDEVRHNSLVKAVFADWELGGKRNKFNDPLHFNLYYASFYKAFCQQIALEMLTTSRQHMKDWLAQLNSDRSQWQTRFNNILQGLRPAAEQTQNLRQQVTTSETTLESLRQELAPLESRYQDQQRYGSLPGGVIGAEELEPLQGRIAEVKIQIETAQNEIGRLASLFQRAEQLNPLLTLLTIRGGQTVRNLETAFLDFNTGEQVVTYLQEQLQWLIRKTKEAEQKIPNDVDIYKLEIVQEEANRQLADWFGSHPPFRESVENLLNRGGLLEWLGLAGALLVLTFLCPPVGVAISLGVSVGTAYRSVSRAMQLSDLSQVRIAQQGFRPFVSDAEVSAAITQAVVDVVFALFEAGMLARSATQAARQTAQRQATRQLGESLERIAVGWRQLESWPDSLTQSIRQRLLEQARTGNIDELVASVKQAMLQYYDNRLLQLQQDFERLLETNPSLSDLQGWIAREFPPPQQFLEELTQRELRSGERLFEETVGERLANQRLKPETVSQAQRTTALSELEQQAATRTEAEAAEEASRVARAERPSTGGGAVTASSVVASTRVEARLLSRGYTAEAIETLIEAGLNVQRGSRLYRQLLSAGQTVRDFINTFYRTPGIEQVITNWAAGGNAQEGARFIMRYCLQELRNTSIRFEWPVGIRYTSTGGETWARYVDIVIDGGTRVNPGNTLYVELKSWTRSTLARSSGRIRFQLTRDRALFDPNSIRWVFNSRKVSWKEVLDTFVKIIRDDPYLAQVWGGTDDEIRAAVSPLIKVF
jgi:hypothetical protein